MKAETITHVAEVDEEEGVPPAGEAPGPGRKPERRPGEV